ncbi:hypothetical protein ABC382_00790 [Lysinibacillus sp. 1P01SD]|uniref:hypothetical protein n=1 Tax=Lysinibacillus sp. 1P01SD TaxID=3132285 RepID=UPI0039A34EDD
MKRFFRWLIYLGCFFILVLSLFNLFEGIFSLNETNNVERAIKAEEREQEKAKLQMEKEKKEEKQKLMEIERVRKETFEAELSKQIGEASFNKQNISNEQLSQQNFYLEFTQQELIESVEKIKIVQANTQKIIDYYMQGNRKSNMEKEIPTVIQKMHLYLENVESKVFNQKKFNENQRRYLSKVVREIHQTIFYARQTFNSLDDYEQRTLSVEEVKNINYTHEQGLRVIEEALIRMDVFEEYMAIPSPIKFVDSYLYKNE